MQENKLTRNFIAQLRDQTDKLKQIEEYVLMLNSGQKNPYKDLLIFYQKQLIPKLKDRSSKSNVFSDILLWYMPQIAVLIYRIEQLIKKKQPEFLNQLNENQDNQNFQEEQQINVLQQLKKPIQYFQKQMTTLLAQCAKQFLNSNRSWTSEELFRVIGIMKKIRNEQANNELQLPIEEYQSKIQNILYQNVVNPKSKTCIKFSYRFLFISKLKIRVKKANKHIVERRLRILQLVEGEKKYINGLSEYIEYIKKPICNLKILSQLQTKKLFSSIQSILGFHQILYQELNNRYQKYHKYQTYGDLIKKKIPFFKLYTDYIQYADQAQTMLLNLEQNNQNVRAICSKFLMQKQKKASDELKQPTFRIARYGMIISQILKNTSNTHPDYILLKQAQKEASVNLTKINQTVDSIARRTRLHQLEQQFGTQQRPIFTPQRSFIQQFHLYYIKDDKFEPVFLFVFSDLVIVIDQNRKILKWIEVNSKFYVRRQQDNKTYRNIVKIHSGGLLTFSAGNQDRHLAKAETLFRILKSITPQSKELDRMVHVHVIGTEEINTSTFSKYTEYIAEIKYLTLRKFTRLRFSLMKNFVSKMQDHYKNDLGINTDENLKDGWFINYSSKTIEDRKRLIEQILQKMLNHPVILANPSFILNQIGIQPSFLRVVDVGENKRQTNSGNFQTLSPLIKAKSEQRYVRQAQTILCATQIKLGRNSYHDPEFISKKVSQSERFTIYIDSMVGQQALAIKISDLYTVEDVCYEVSNMLDLKTNRDFKLFHEVGKKQLRVLDNDKKIIKLFNFPKKQNGVKASIYDIFHAVRNYILPQATPKLIFKKYYYLPLEIQKSQCKKDTTRLRLLVYQVFAQIKDMKYNLTFQDYLLYLAILIYIEYDGVPEQTEPSYVNRIIPQKIFKIKNQTEEYWLKQCRPHLEWLHQQINKIIENNKQKIKNRRIRVDSALHFGHRHICSQLALSKIRGNKNYGANLFYVQLPKQTYEKFEKEGKKPSYNLWLAIKFDCLMLCSPTSKQVILQIQLKNIQRIIVQTQGLIFKIESLASCQYGLNTCQSFQISELVKYYKCLSETIDQLENNENLIAKTKEYKQELSNYRNSYGKAERQTSEIQNTKEQILEVFSGFN